MGYPHCISNIKPQNIFWLKIHCFVLFSFQNSLPVVTNYQITNHSKWQKIASIKRKITCRGQASQIMWSCIIQQNWICLLVFKSRNSEGGTEVLGSHALFTTLQLMETKMKEWAKWWPKAELCWIGLKIYITFPATTHPNEVKPMHALHIWQKCLKLHLIMK